MRATPQSADWFAIANVSDVPTPALLVYPKRVEENIRRAISITSGVERLRPHVKTHKMEEIVRMHVSRGVTKFKCATIAEAEMTASAGAPDVLLAYQPLGPNVQRLVRLVQKFPQTKFAVIADDRNAIAALSAALSAAGRTISVLLDVDCGMHRTGVLPNDDAFELYRWMTTLSGLSVEGLHPYDGHIHDSDATLREKNCDAAFAPVAQFRQRLRDAGFPKVNVVAGGTPTFSFHARRGDVECSPGTYVFWDFGYASAMPDLKFELPRLS
jgi:D-serine deaminase-like pyridoxal phosphate-dependent protein